MSLLSKLTLAAVAVLGVRALNGKRTAKALVDGTPKRKPAKAPGAARKLASTAKGSTALESHRGSAAPKADSRKRPDPDRTSAAPKARSRKRAGRRVQAKRAQT